MRSIKGRVPVRLAINGACGRMGQQIAGLALADGGFRIAAALETAGHSALGRDYGGVLGRGPLGIPVRARLDGRPEADVLVDFSTPEAAAARLRECRRLRLPIVIGTTGLTPSARRAIAAAGRSIPVVQAPNMSVGVNALLQVLPDLARLLGGTFDVEVVEAHHRLKRDAPSGTALALAGAMARARGLDLGRAAVYGRRGDTGVRPPGVIGILAVRAGDIAGEHRVILGGFGETIEVVHRAHSRVTFALGALRAARFAAGARRGVYSMIDVLRAGGGR